MHYEAASARYLSQKFWRWPIQNGFPLAERNARYWVAKSLLEQPGYKETYLPDGVAPILGDEFRNPAHANSLRQVAGHGRDAFYNGPMSESMVKFLQAQGGTHTVEGFRDFQPEWVEPISPTYRGWTVYELPPNGQGIAALSMLNIMQQFPLAQYPHNSADGLHIMIEAKKLAYADMYKLCRGPAFTPVPVKEMLSKELVKKRAALVKMDKAACQFVPCDIEKMLDAHGNSTIYLSVIDKDGNVVFLIQSNFGDTGIVANEWYDRKSGKMTYCVEDATSPLLKRSASRSVAADFWGDGFGDWLQASFSGLRQYSISLKDRAAILMGGRHPQGAFWFSHDDGEFMTSRYYADRLPGWVEEFNKRHLADNYAGKTWTPLLESTSPAYHTKEVTSQFPHAIPHGSGQGLYDAVYGSPFGDELLEAFAEATVTSNQLGQKGVPDLLAVSFSSNDAVGHAYGPFSPEIADEQIRLDRTLARLMSFVNERVGRENASWVLSADHGAEPDPEAERTLNFNVAAQRLPFSEALKSIGAQLNAIFHVTGEMHWFAAHTDTMLYLDQAQLAKHGISLQAACSALTTKVHDVPGIAGFYDPSRLPPSGWIATYLQNSDYSPRSGDVYYLTKEWTYFSSNPTGTSHGDPRPTTRTSPLFFKHKPSTWWTLHIRSPAS